LHYYIGVDGGGTKTAVAASDESAGQIFRTETGSAAWREYGIDPVVQTIKAAIAALPFAPDAAIAGIALGLPCYGEQVEGEKDLEQALYAAFPDVPLYFCNDVEVGWAGSLGLSPGINVVAGTGAIAFGKDERAQAVRCGGWSEFFGDEGSCYWIGRQVMGLFSKQSDGRMERDALYDVVRSTFSLTHDFDFIDLMYGEYMMYRDQVASLQLLAKEAALAGSPGALALYAAASEELCLLVRSIRDQLSFSETPFLVSYTGGLFRAEDLILSRFSEGVRALGGRLVPPQFGPAEGALALAFSKFHSEGLSGLLQLLNKNK